MNYDPIFDLNVGELVIVSKEKGHYEYATVVKKLTSNLFINDFEISIENAFMHTTTTISSLYIFKIEKIWLLHPPIKFHFFMQEINNLPENLQKVALERVKLYESKNLSKK